MKQLLQAKRVSNRLDKKLVNIRHEQSERFKKAGWVPCVVFGDKKVNIHFWKSSCSYLNSVVFVLESRNLKLLKLNDNSVQEANELFEHINNVLSGGIIEETKMK